MSQRPKKCEGMCRTRKKRRESGSDDYTQLGNLAKVLNFVPRRLRGQPEGCRLWGCRFLAAAKAAARRLGVIYTSNYVLCQG